MILARITLAIAILTVTPLTPTYAGECDHVNGSAAKECYYRLAEALWRKVLDPVIVEKCEKISKDPADAGFCIYDGMRKTHSFAVNWQPNN